MDQTDTSAFTAMLQDNQAALERLARRYAGPHDWRDLLQEIHLQLWRSFGSFDGRAQRSTWVYRVALNTALSHVRRPRRPHVPLDAAPERGCSGHAVDPMDVLETFLAGLEPVARAILVMDLEGLAREQIAEVLGITPNAVAVRMTRLRRKFEEQFLEA